MAFAYSIKDQGAVYFVTFTVHQWVDIFTRPIYRDILLESLRYCQETKGLKIFAWVIMSNHIHLIVRSQDENLSDIIRDLKKFTSKKIVKAIEDNPHESRKEWLLLALKVENKIWFWEEGYHGVEINSIEMFESKVNYIHLNPVRNGLVKNAEDYLLSSAKDFLNTGERVLNLSFINE
jgi:REP element-mobilizing transposase RayT